MSEMPRPTVTKQRTQRLCEELRRRWGLTKSADLYLGVMCRTVADVLRFADNGSDHLMSCSLGGAIYSRDIVPTYGGSGDWVRAQVTITRDNYMQLPTSELRARARELLGLAPVAEVQG